MDNETTGGALAARKEFGATESTFGRTNIAAEAAAAKAKATVEARYIMAIRRPRTMEDVRALILKECRRPSFAHNKSTLYNKPVGKGIEGLGIRFVEMALRCMTNVSIEASTAFEDDKKEIVSVTVTDLETNVPWSLDVKVNKTVERSKPADDGTYISVRKNSYGKNTYTVWASDDDLLNKRGALISKAARTLGLRVIPGDIQDEAESTIRQIRLDKAAKDPDAERKRIADAFGELGVKPSEIENYIGHGLGSCSPAELVKLRGLYGAIRDGEATWQDAVDSAGEPEKKRYPLDSVKQREPDKRQSPPADDPDKPAEWPKWVPNEGGGGHWVEEHGVIYDPEVHAGYTGLRPPLNADGTFRARRGKTHEAAARLNEAHQRLEEARSRRGTQPPPAGDGEGEPGNSGAAGSGQDDAGAGDPPAGGEVGEDPAKAEELTRQAIAIIERCTTVDQLNEQEPVALDMVRGTGDVNVVEDAAVRKYRELRAQ